MTIRVELYGIPRQRAETDTVLVQVGSKPVRLADVLRDLAARYPELAAACFDGERLQSGYVANIGGERFVTDPETTLRAGDSLLIMSADAGG